MASRWKDREVQPAGSVQRDHLDDGDDQIRHDEEQRAGFEHQLDCGIMLEFSWVGSTLDSRQSSSVNLDGLDLLSPKAVIDACFGRRCRELSRFIDHLKMEVVTFLAANIGQIEGEGQRHGPKFRCEKDPLDGAIGINAWLVRTEGNHGLPDEFAQQDVISAPEVSVFSHGDPSEGSESQVGRSSRRVEQWGHRRPNRQLISQMVQTTRQNDRDS